MVIKNKRRENTIRKDLKLILASIFMVLKDVYGENNAHLFMRKSSKEFEYHIQRWIELFKSIKKFINKH